MYSYEYKEDVDYKKYKITYSRTGGYIDTDYIYGEDEEDAELRFYTDEEFEKIEVLDVVIADGL